jgi:transposase-like protein
MMRPSSSDFNLASNPFLGPVFKVAARKLWKYLYRALDYQGNTVDFLLSEQSDIAAAKRFFKKAMASLSVGMYLIFWYRWARRKH